MSDNNEKTKSGFGHELAILGGTIIAIIGATTYGFLTQPKPAAQAEPTATDPSAEVVPADIRNTTHATNGIFKLESTVGAPTFADPLFKPYVSPIKESKSTPAVPDDIHPDKYPPTILDLTEDSGTIIYEGTGPASIEYKNGKVFVNGGEVGTTPRNQQTQPAK